MSDLLLREAVVEEVQSSRREIILRAVAYGTFSNVDDGHGRYQEAFKAGAMADHIRLRGDRVRMLRDHDPLRAIGRVEHWDDTAASLIVRSKISATTLGDETLELARDGVLSPSVGFLDPVNGAGHVGQRLTRTKVFLREISLVPFAARDDASVLSVREEAELVVERPLLDQWKAWLALQSPTPAVTVG